MATKSHDTPISLAGRVWRLITCQRRAAPVADPNALAPVYQDLIIMGAKLAKTEEAKFEKMAWWSQAQTTDGARIFVVCARDPDRGPEAYFDMRELRAYSTFKLHEHVVTQNKRYAVVWAQLNDHRVWPLSALIFKNCLPQRYADNLDAIHVVHPSMTVRFMRLALWPVASEEFWDQFHSHERIEFLAPHVNQMKKLLLPDDLYKYDKWLDKQAEEMSRKANQQMGSGRWSSASWEAEQKQHQEQMKELQRLMKAREAREQEAKAARNAKRD